MTPARILMSPGTASAEIVNGQGQAYTSDARLPIPVWRPPTQAENSAIWADVLPEMGRVVAIVEVLDQECIEKVRQWVPALQLLAGTQREHWDHPSIKMLLEKMEAVVSVSGALDCNGIAEHPPGLTTVTIDHERQSYIGLHTDSWDRLPVEQLASARNRICINLGREDRYLLFLNLTVGDMLAHLPTASQAAPITSASAIGKAFMRAHPDYPIAKVRIRPGEAYIAPTENIVHDASSLDNFEQSCHITLRGFFRPLEKAAGYQHRLTAL